MLYQLVSDQYKHSFFFVETVLDWNHLDEYIAGSVNSGEFLTNFSKVLV